MAIMINTSQALRRPADLRQLVEAVVAARPDDEAHWVEWKGTLPLDAAEGWFSISKQILGFANRHPERAARFAEGIGYLIVGAQPAKVSGVSPVDVAKLDDWLRGYLGGDDGPTWAPTYVTVDGKDVLVVVVEAPRWGDRMFVLRKTYHSQLRGKDVEKGADRGTVFVRREASTERADDAEIDMLQERLLRGQRQPPLDLSLDLEGEPSALLLLDTSDEACQRWIDARRQVLLRSLEGHQRHEPPTEEERRRMERVERAVGRHLNARPRTLADVFRNTDFRTAALYRAEVDEYLRDLNGPLMTAMAADLVRAGKNSVRLIVTNPSERNLPKVKVTLHISDGVAAFDGPLDERMPEPPPPFGSPALPRGFRGRFPRFDSALIQAAIAPALSAPRSLEIYNTDGSTTLEFYVGDLRPRHTADLRSFTLIVGERPDRSALRVNWSATSTGVDGVCEGTFELPLADRALTPLDLVPYEESGDGEERGFS